MLFHIICRGILYVMQLTDESLCITHATYIPINNKWAAPAHQLISCARAATYNMYWN